MTKDLGTYHFKAYFTNGKSYIFRVDTGHRYTMGSGNDSPIDAFLIKPTWGDEEELVSTIVFGLTENGCDCKRILDWCRSQQIDLPDDIPCGDTWVLSRLVMVRPDATEVTIAI